MALSALINFKLFDSREVLKINILLSFNMQNLHKHAFLDPLKVTESTYECKGRFVSSLLQYLGKKSALNIFLGEH